MPSSLATAGLALGAILVAAGAELAGIIVASVAYVWELVVTLTYRNEP